jgi:hypothetical protein
MDEFVMTFDRPIDVDVIAPILLAIDQAWPGATVEQIAGIGFRIRRAASDAQDSR